MLPFKATFWKASKQQFLLMTSSPTYRHQRLMGTRFDDAQWSPIFQHILFPYLFFNCILPLFKAMIDELLKLSNFREKKIYHQNFLFNL